MIVGTKALETQSRLFWISASSMWSKIDSKSSMLSRTCNAGGSGAIAAVHQARPLCLSVCSQLSRTQPLAVLPRSCKLLILEIGGLMIVVEYQHRTVMLSLAAE